MLNRVSTRGRGNQLTAHISKQPPPRSKIRSTVSSARSSLCGTVLWHCSSSIIEGQFLNIPQMGGRANVWIEPPNRISVSASFVQRDGHRTESSKDTLSSLLPPSVLHVARRCNTATAYQGQDVELPKQSAKRNEHHYWKYGALDVSAQQRLYTDGATRPSIVEHPGKGNRGGHTLQQNMREDKLAVGSQIPALYVLEAEES